MTTPEEKKPPRFMALRRILFHNFWLKLLALALAVIIYFTLRSGVGVGGNDYFKGSHEQPWHDLKGNGANADR